jgi:hypothetical protein
MTHRGLLWARTARPCIAIIGAVLTGCSGPPQADPVHGTLAPHFSLAERLLGLSSDGWAIDLPSKGRSSIAVETTADGWIVRTPWEHLTLVRAEDGSICLQREHDLLEHIIVTFDPAMPIMTEALAHGTQQLHTCSGSMRIVRDNERRSLLTHGTWTLQLERGLDASGPLGPLAVLTTRWHADLGLASAHVHAVETMDPNIGPMHLDRRVRRTILGFPTDGVRAWKRVLDDAPLEQVD